MARKTENATSVEPQRGADGLFYRVEHVETGHVVTVVADAYDPDVHVLLDEPAVDSDGAPLAPRFKGEPKPETPEPPAETPVV